MQMWRLSVNSEQMIEMLKLLSERFIITCFTDRYDYIFTTRLYPTDRYINANHKTFEGAFEIFITQILEHVGGKLKEEMLEIMK